MKGFVTIAPSLRIAELADNIMKSIMKFKDDRNWKENCLTMKKQGKHWFTGKMMYNAEFDEEKTGRYLESLGIQEHIYVGVFRDTLYIEKGLAFDRLKKLVVLLSAGTPMMLDSDLLEEYQKLCKL